MTEFTDLAGTTNSTLTINGRVVGLTLDASNLTTNRTLKFPDSNGLGGQVLQTDGSGNLTWTTPSGSGTTFAQIMAYIELRI